MSACQRSSTFPLLTARQTGGSLPLKAERDLKFHSAAPAVSAPRLRATEKQQLIPQALLDDRFDSLAGLVNEYVRSVPPLSHTDCETDRFVEWIQDQPQIDAEQRDWLLCLYSQRAVEMTALHKRLAHARYHELLRANSEQGRQLSPAAVICLNPVHVWATFQTRLLLDDQCEVPARVLFYQVGDEVHTAVLNDPIQHLVRSLEHRTLTLKQLLREFFPGNSPAGLAFVQELARRKILAFSNR